MMSFLTNRLFPALALALALAPAVLSPRASAASGSPVIIGLDTDLSSSSAQSGEAIRRGAATAIAEINASGGLLGHPLNLVVRDHRGIPARGRDNVDDLAALPNLLAILGGAHTPVALDELEQIHLYQIPFLIPWAAGTMLVDNGRSPNFVFRVSVRDEFAGGFLVRKTDEAGYRSLGLLLERTAWGRSNERAIVAAVNDNPRVRLARTEWFNRGAHSLDDAIDRVAAAGADAILLVSGAPEGTVLVRAMAARSQSQRLPIISHWGIASGSFVKDTGPAVKAVDLRVLQTMLFARPPFPDRVRRFFATYRRLFTDVASPEDILSPAGTAHAYDLIHMLAMAVRKAGTVDRQAVRDALEHLGRYQGLVRDYDPPFTPQRHDALTAADFQMGRYADGGRIVPEIR